jgi:hypothetical protein
MLKGDTNPRKRPISSATPQKEANWNIAEGNNHRQLTRKHYTPKHCTPNIALQTNVFSAAQTNHVWIGTDHRQVSHLHAPKVKRSTATLIPGCAGGTGITFISGDWSRRNGGNPFPQIITRQAEKPVCDNTEIPDIIDRHIPVKARWDRMSPHKPPNRGAG